jgi:hypothetical protein
VAANPARFRRDGNKVQLEGTVSAPGGTGNGGTERTVVFTLPEDHRPSAQCDFDVASASGTTTVTVMPDGSVLANPNEEWVRFDGIEFTTN